MDSVELILVGLELSNLLVSGVLLFLTMRRVGPARKAHTARDICDEAIVLAERSKLKGVAKTIIAVDYCENEGKRHNIKMNRNQWAKLVEIRFQQGIKLAKPE